jgi:mono/diheme cytochrome c family protein
MLNSRFRQIPLALLAGFIFLLVMSLPAAAQEGIDQEKLDQGARLYAENCAVCHGPDGKGRIGATLAKNWPSIRPDLAIQETIQNGVPGSPMPAWSASNGGPLSDEEIGALVYYILSWETGGPILATPGPTFTPRPAISPVPDVEGDPNKGAVLYDQNCAVCHGPNGEGRIGATLDKSWPSIRPDLRVKNTIANGVDGSPMPAWSQANGGPLGESDINDLVSFILSWSANAQVEFIAPTPTSAPISTASSWVGFLIALILIAVIVAAILLLQRRRPAS